MEDAEYRIVNGDYAADMRQITARPRVRSTLDVSVEELNKQLDYLESFEGNGFIYAIKEGKILKRSSRASTSSSKSICRCAHVCRAWARVSCGGARRRRHAGRMTKIYVPLRAAEDEKNKYLGDDYERQRRTIETNARRRTEDLRRQLAIDKTPHGQGVGRLSPTRSSRSRRTPRSSWLLAQERRKKLQAIARATEDDIIAAMPEGENKEREQLRARQERETADLYEKMYNEGEQPSEAELIALTQQADAMYARHSKGAERPERSVCARSYQSSARDVAVAAVGAA